MKDLITQARSVETRVRTMTFSWTAEAADTISALCAALEAAQKLSVTNIMLDVVPGWDGMGDEVYAKSVDEVVEALSKLGCEAEDAQGDLHTARVKLEAAQETIQQLNRALRDEIEAPTFMGEPVSLLRKPVVKDSLSSEPAAFRHSFDGYGWLYCDDGSGSSWKEMVYPDKEFLFTRKMPTIERLESDDTEGGAL